MTPMGLISNRRNDGKPPTRLLGAQNQGIGNPTGDDRAVDGSGRPYALPDDAADLRTNSRRSASIGQGRCRLYFNTRKVSIYGGSNEIQPAESSRRRLRTLTMDFELSGEQQMLRDNVARLMKDRYGFEARNRHQASARGWSEALAREYADMGLLGAPPEDDGGYGGSVR